MYMTKRGLAFGLLSLVTVALLLPSVGCVADPRTSNQGGGSLLTAGTKLLGQRIGDLTADEWQIIGDNLPALVTQFNIDLQGYSIPVLDDDAAAAIVDFLNDHNIVTVDELVAAYDSGEITADDVPEELVGLLD